MGREVSGSRRLPLRGADLVLVGLASRYGGGINNAILVAETDGPVDTARAREALSRLVDEVPWPAARLGRPFPWGRLRWSAGSRRSLTVPPLQEVVLPADKSIESVVENEMSARIDPWRGSPTRFTVVREKHGRSAFVMAWSRPLMDPRGAENVLKRLARLDEDPGYRFPAWAAPKETMSLEEWGRVGRRARDHMKTIVASPVSPGRAVAVPGRARFLRRLFGEGPSAGSRVGRDVSFRLAVTAKVVAELFRRRGLPEAPFLIPLSVDLRRRGEEDPLFGNCLAFHFARFEAHETADSMHLAGVLRRNLAYAFRDGMIEANRVGMEFLRYRPIRSLLREMVWARGGDAFSFNCADTGVFAAGLHSIFGAKLTGGYHVPEVLPRPGLGIFFSRFGDHPSVAVGWVEGVLDDGEAHGLAASIGEEMGWVPES